MPPAKLATTPSPCPEPLILEGSGLPVDKRSDQTDGRNCSRTPVISVSGKAERTPRMVLSPAVIPLPNADVASLRENNNGMLKQPYFMDCLSIKTLSAEDKDSMCLPASLSPAKSPLSTLPLSPTPSGAIPSASESKGRALSISSVKLPPLGVKGLTTQDVSTGSHSNSPLEGMRGSSASHIRSRSSKSGLSLEGRNVGSSSPGKMRRSPDKVLPVYHSRNGSCSSPLEVNGSTMPVYVKSDGGDTVDADRESNVNTPTPQSRPVPFYMDPEIELSEATKRMIQAREGGDNRMKNLTTVTLPKLFGVGKQVNAGVTPRFAPMGQFSKSPTPRIGEATSRQEKRDDLRNHVLNKSLCLGPSNATAEPAEEMPEPPPQTDSFNLRKEYGKNLERNWYQQVLEEERSAEEHRKFLRLCKLHKLDKSLDDFYMSFYSSGSENENDDMSKPGAVKKAALSDGDVDRHDVDAGSPLMRFASTDVLVSDQSEESGSDIDVVIQEDQVVAKSVRHKMRRHRKRREARYQMLFGPELEAEQRKAEFDEGTYYMSDTDIRAMRLNLRKNDDNDDLGYDETCTIAELKQQMMNVLDKWNRGKKGKSKKKKRRGKSREESRGYDDHLKESMYDRFIKEYGHLLEGYKVDPLSDESESDPEEVDPINYVPYNGFPGPASGHITTIHAKLPSLNTNSSPLTSKSVDSIVGQTEEMTGEGRERLLDAVTQFTMRRRKTRLQKVLKRLHEDRNNLLQRADTTKYAKTPRSARRNSDPGVHQGRILVHKIIIKTEEDITEEEQTIKEAKLKKSKKKGKKKAKKVSKKPALSHELKGIGVVEAGVQDAARSSSSLDQIDNVDSEFKDKPIRRTKSCRHFRAFKDKEISLRELTNGYDFPSKDVKLEIAERRLQRQRMRKGKLGAKELREKVEEKNREERRKLIALAKAEYLKHLEKARAEVGLVTNDSEDEDSIFGDEQLGVRRKSIKNRVRRRSNGLLLELNPKPDYKVLVNDSPYVSAGVSWSHGSENRQKIEVSREEVEEEAENVSDLLLQMKECRYIRWSNVQQRIIDYVNELELVQYDDDWTDD